MFKFISVHSTDTKPRSERTSLKSSQGRESRIALKNYNPLEALVELLILEGSSLLLAGKESV